MLAASPSQTAERIDSTVKCWLLVISSMQVSFLKGISEMHIKFCYASGTVLCELQSMASTYSMHLLTRFSVLEFRMFQHNTAEFCSGWMNIQQDIMATSLSNPSWNWFEDLKATNEWQRKGMHENTATVITYMMGGPLFIHVRPASVSAMVLTVGRLLLADSKPQNPWSQG